MTGTPIPSQAPRGPGTVIALLLACIGIAYASWLLLDYARFASKAHEVPGEIVARDSTRFTIRYRVNGQSFQIEEKLPMTRGGGIHLRRQLQPGVQVPVLYDPAAPQGAKWKSNRLWLFPAALLCVCLLVALAALFPDALRRSFRS